jgi:hypothetical protein
VTRKSRTDAELKTILRDLRTTDDQIIAALREVLTEYVTELPAFRTKPQGGPNSPARREQLKDIAREDRAKALLEGKHP